MQLKENISTEANLDIISCMISILINEFFFNCIFLFFNGGSPTAFFLLKVHYEHFIDDEVVQLLSNLCTS